MKTCSKCKEEKELSCFSKLTSSNDGYNYSCKSCANSYYTKKKEIAEEGFKKCSSCKNVKTNDSFSKNSNAKSGLRSSCKVCANIQEKEYRERCPEVGKAYRDNNKEVLVIAKAKYYENNKNIVKENVRKWEKENPEKVKISKKKYADNNKYELQAKNNEREKNRRDANPEYRFTRNLRSLIGQSFSRILSGKLKRSKKSIELLGCDFEFFFTYIEAKFKKGMTFKNYGEWELDHIKPISSANSITEVEQLNHYTNFQPLWKSENRVKSNKIEIIQLKLI